MYLADKDSGAEYNYGRMSVIVGTSLMEIPPIMYAYTVKENAAEITLNVQDCLPNQNYT